MGATLTAVTETLAGKMKPDELARVLLQQMEDAARRDEHWNSAPMLRATSEFVQSVKEDCARTDAHRRFYHPEKPPTGSAMRDVVEQIGLQMMVVVRVMQWARNANMPMLARMCSRMIRHLYNAEIHWNTKLDPGVTLIHGLGLVLGHEAHVETGCILFHNVTLGEGMHPDTGERGTPHLERNVHVGPGCTLLGPIVVGEGSKLMAGCVLTRSVPPGSRVLPTDVTVRQRQPKPRSTERRPHA